MMRNVPVLVVVAGLCAFSAEARAAEPSGPSRAVAEGEGGGQLGGLGKGLSIAKKANDVRELQMTEAEEQALGQSVSLKIREKYGVAQDAGVHRYVSLVGLALAQGSTRPALPWTFIVLDTDAVNAFAAPGGYIHVTRGALAMLKSESELAGLLAHELIHVTEKHTIRAIQKGKLVQMGAAETLSGNAGLMERAVNASYSHILDNNFGRADENESDEKGAALANKTGYAPNGMIGFLTSLKERNKAKKEKSGLFASHPEMQERLDRITKQITTQKLMASASLPERYKKNITYTLVDVDALVPAEEGSAGAVGGTTAKKEEPKKEEPKKSGGLGGLRNMVRPGGGEAKQASVTGSGSARGGVPNERDAKGGSNPAVVAVKIAAADVAAFRKEGGLS